MDNLRGELRDSIPVRPIYVMEEKKCHDIIYALLNVNYEKRSRKDMQNIFDESYKGNGVIRKPLLSLMMWGPYADFNCLKLIKNASLITCSQDRMSALTFLRSIIGCILTVREFLAILVLF